MSAREIEPGEANLRIDVEQRIAVAKLGQLLISRGWINLPQLTRALKNQSVVGGRLGTCLLEMDVLTEEQLAKGLAEQLGLPGATIEQLRSVPEEVRGVLPAKVARRCHAVPFQLSGNRLDVVMLDPRNLSGHDEVAFASGRRVRVHVAPELRIFEALERFYNEECPSRFTLLLDRLNRARYLWNEEKSEEPAPVEEPIPNRRRSALGLDRFPDLPILGPERKPGPLLDLPVTAKKSATDIFPLVRPLGSGPPPGPARPATPVGKPTASQETARPPAPPPRPAEPLVRAAPAPRVAPPAPPAPAQVAAPPPAPAPTVARVIPLTEAERADLARAEAAPSLAVEPPIPVSAPAPAPVQNPPATLDELTGALEATTDRDDLAHLMLAFLVRRFDRAALFQVARGQVVAWLAMGKNVDSEAFGKYRVGLDQPSVFLNLDRGNSLYLGPLPPMPAHRELAKAWGGALPQRACMLPIRIGNRLVAVLYADGDDTSWSGFGIDVLNRLGADFAAALERCIRQRRGKTA
ncbi:MAG TPA: hypothetical protein VGS22_17830 [Thermoanaerobaculia bacterium]|jgi:hypothetical protein|nr:hypothetical protein [Thermoanaerobaculia bacterium]